MASDRDQALRVAAIKVGLLTVVGIVLLVGVLMWLRGRSLVNGTQFSVTFQDVDGLKQSAPVQMMGIRIGFVDEVIPERVGAHYQVRVNFNLSRSSVVVPRGSLLTIQQSGLIGEKFLEITPPAEQTCQRVGETLADLTVRPAVEAGTLLWGQYLDQPTVVGQVEAAEGPQHLLYRLTRRSIPPSAACYWHDNKWWVTPPGKPLLAVAPKGIPPQFVVESPLRMKAFLDIQLQTAEALRDTNLKISQLLTDDTIAALTNTVANTEHLTQEAAALLASAHTLVQESGHDIRHLVVTADALAASLSEVSTNVNDLLANGELQADVRTSVASIRSASQSLDGLLSDPALKETLSLTQQTARDASQLSALLNRTAHDPNFQYKMETSLTNLNNSLVRVDSVLGAVEQATGPNNSELKELVDNAQVTAKNLRKVSERLNKRFLLFRLMF
ncbi:MAG: MlaD family protein [Vampirovibrionales bacterium]|nr:MlaD family protein [Vampirovibrionales bacterium]